MVGEKMHIRAVQRNAVFFATVPSIEKQYKYREQGRTSNIETALRIKKPFSWTLMTNTEKYSDKCV